MKVKNAINRGWFAAFRRVHRRGTNAIRRQVAIVKFAFIIKHPWNNSWARRTIRQPVRIESIDSSICLQRIIVVAKLRRWRRQNHLVTKSLVPLFVHVNGARMENGAKRKMRSTRMACIKKKERVREKQMEKNKWKKKEQCQFTGETFLKIASCVWSIVSSLMRIFAPLFYAVWSIRYNNISDCNTKISLDYVSLSDNTLMHFYAR